MSNTLIIGAGITGAALAFQLSRRGESVSADTSAWSGCGLVNGYWFGDAGIADHHHRLLQEIGADA